MTKAPVAPPSPDARPSSFATAQIEHSALRLTRSNTQDLGDFVLTQLNYLYSINSRESLSLPTLSLLGAHFRDFLLSRETPTGRTLSLEASTFLERYITFHKARRLFVPNPEDIHLRLLLHMIPYFFDARISSYHAPTRTSL